jgi:dihydroxyacetone kinase
LAAGGIRDTKEKNTLGASGGGFGHGAQHAYEACGAARTSCAGRVEQPGPGSGFSPMAASL